MTIGNRSKRLSHTKLEPSIQCKAETLGSKPFHSVKVIDLCVKQAKFLLFVRFEIINVLNPHGLMEKVNVR